MPDWIYRASDSQVDAQSTAALLYPHGAIWCCPPGLRSWNGDPAAGERLWLVWEGQNIGGPPILLGGGRILAAQRRLYNTDLLWTDADVRGLNRQAGQLGYEVGNGTSFLRLQLAPNLPLGTFPALGGIGMLQPMFNQVSPQQVPILDALIPIP